MTTAAQLRAAILRCAANAIVDEPADIGARARMFVARLSGAFDVLGETELDRTLTQLIGRQPDQSATAGDSDREAK